MTIFHDNQWRPIQWGTIVAVPAIVFMYIVSIYYPFFNDDAFISLRYAGRLLAGKGLNWNDGEHVEGYSNLLWILLTALPGVMGANLVWAGRAICMLGTLSTCAALLYFARVRSMHWLTGLAGLFYLASARPVAVWSIGGLETSLHMALITWIAVLGWLQFYEKRISPYRWILAMLMGLIAINRPDGILFTVIFSFLFWLAAKFRPASHANRREVLYITLASLILPFMQLLFRIYYYHDIVPNTFYAKVAFNMQRLYEGIDYVKDGVIVLLPILITITVLSALAFRSGIRNFGVILYLLVPTGVWLVAVSAAGGDIFPAYRHLVPILGLFGLLLMVSMDAVLATRWWVTLTIVSLGLYYFSVIQFYDQPIDRARLETWEWQDKDFGERLNQLFAGEQPLLAVGRAGALPYYSRLPTVDMFGLNDAYLTKHKSNNFGHGRLAHELYNRDYVVMRNPDIIIFDGSMAQDVDSFREKYSQQFENFSWGTADMWVRKDSKYFYHFQNPQHP